MSNKLMLGLNFALAGLLAVIAVIYITDRQNLPVAAVSPPAQEFGEQVHEYILANPEIVREALLELEAREVAAQAAQQQMAITQYAQLIFNSETDFVTGNPDGDVTLVEFFDYNCGFCRRALSDLDRLLEEDPNLRVVLKEFPVLGPGSIAAAKVSMAAIGEEGFYEFHRQLLIRPGGVDGNAAIEVAEAAGMDATRVLADSEDQSIVNTLSETLQMAQALGINGTPSYVIGSQLVIGAVGYEELKQRIAEERARLVSATN